MVLNRRGFTGQSTLWQSYLRFRGSLGLSKDGGARTVRTRTFPFGTGTDTDRSVCVSDGDDRRTRWHSFTQRYHYGRDTRPKPYHPTKLSPNIWTEHEGRERTDGRFLQSQLTFPCESINPPSPSWCLPNLTDEGDKWQVIPTSVRS